MATSELMKTYDAAVWATTGFFCSGSDFDATFGLDAYHRESGPDPCAGPQCGPGRAAADDRDDELRAIARFQR